MNDFDFISATDKPALLAFSTPEWLDSVKTSLQELGYKVHTAATHCDFLIRFSQVHYQVVILEENFLPRGATVMRTVDASIGIRRIHVAERSHEDGVGILGIDDDATDLFRVFESEMLPRLAGV